MIGAHELEEIRADVLAHVGKNYREISLSNSCRCLHCLNRIAPDDVNWIAPNGERLGCIGSGKLKRKKVEDATSCCPKCGSCSVIGDVAGFPLNDADFLDKVQFGWISDAPNK